MKKDECNLNTTKNIKIDSEDKKLAAYISLYFAVQAINSSIKNIVPMSDNMWQNLSLFCGVVLFIGFIYTLPIALKRNALTFFIAETIFSALYIISFCIGNADFDLLLKQALWTLCLCVPIGLYATMIISKQKILEYIRKTSYFVCPVVWIGLNNTDMAVQYNMSLSYTLLLPCILFMYNFSKKHNGIDFIYAAISLSGLVLFGARGPNVCILFYLLCYLFVILKFTKWKLILSIILGLIILCTTINYKLIINNIESVLYQNSIYSRNFILMVNNNLNYDSGRGLLFSYYNELIMQKPFFGWGIFGGWLDESLGPHNSLIECLLAFGIPIGVLLCLLFIALPFKMFIIKDNDLRDIIIIFSACNITKYFVSGNWLTTPIWFIFMFICLLPSTKRTIG